MTESDATDRAKGRSQQAALLSTPLRVNEILLLASLGCYVAGFVITNLYLGSLGAASFDILRTRYVLSGLLFAVFLATVFMPLRSVLRILWGSEGRSVVSVTINLVGTTVETYMILYVAIAAIGTLAGSATTAPIGLPWSSSTLRWTDWFRSVQTLFRPGLLATALYLLAFAVLIILISMAILIVRPKRSNGMRPSRMELLRQLTNAQSRKSLFRTVVIFVLISLSGVVVLSLIRLVGGDNLPRGVGLPFSTGLQIPNGLLRFIAGAFALYLLGVLYILAARRGAPSDSWPEDDAPRRRILAFTYLGAISTGLILPLYTLGIYPSIPQQIGGGRVIPVEMAVSHDEIAAQFDAPSTSVYLIDRTSKGFLLLIVDEGTQTRKVMEIDSSQVQSVTYEPGVFGKMVPEPTPAPATSPINQQQTTPEPTLTPDPVSPP